MAPRRSTLSLTCNQAPNSQEFVDVLCSYPHREATTAFADAIAQGGKKAQGAMAACVSDGTWACTNGTTSDVMCIPVWQAFLTLPQVKSPSTVMRLVARLHHTGEFAVPMWVRSDSSRVCSTHSSTRWMALLLQIYSQHGARV